MCNFKCLVSAVFIFSKANQIRAWISIAPRRQEIQALSLWRRIWGWNSLPPSLSLGPCNKVESLYSSQKALSLRHHVDPWCLVSQVLQLLPCEAGTQCQHCSWAAWWLESRLSRVPQPFSSGVLRPSRVLGELGEGRTLWGVYQPQPLSSSGEISLLPWATLQFPLPLHP